MRPPRPPARMGFPVVTKPLDGNHGRGVGLSLTDEKSVRLGFERALEQSRDGRVVVETFVRGNDYRMLVIGGRMVAIAERVPAHVIGDGEHTVRELVEITNQDPRRGIGHEKVLTRITGRREGRGVRARAGLRVRRRPSRGSAGPDRCHRQHVDGRHLDRPHVGGPRGQRRDRRGSREGRGSRCRGDRLPGAGHHAPRPRDRRRDRGGERRAGLPDAHAPHRRGAAVRRQAGDRRAVPAGHAVADPDRRGDRLEREDHHHPDDRPHLPGSRPQDRDDLDGRRLHRRAAGEAGRRVGAEIGPDGAAEPAGGHGRVRGRPRRHPPRGPRATAGTTSGSC